MLLSPGRIVRDETQSVRGQTHLGYGHGATHANNL